MWLLPEGDTDDGKSRDVLTRTPRATYGDDIVGLQYGSDGVDQSDSDEKW